MSLELILTTVHAGTALPAQLRPLIEAAKPSSRLANICLIDFHWVINAVLFGAAARFALMTGCSRRIFADTRT